MSNSFNISVKPEIAAAVIKIESNKTVIDAIRATDVPDIQTNIDANETAINYVGNIVVDIHDTELPGIITEIDANEAKIDLIRGTDVPNIQTNIDANETKIDAVKTVADAIKTKTDATPQNVRSTFLMARFNTTNPAFQDAVNVSGQGRVFIIYCYAVDGDTMEVNFVIDGVTWSVTEIVATSNALIPNIDATYTSYKFKLIATPAGDEIGGMGNIEFDTSLLIQLRRTAGAGNGGVVKVYYAIDDF